MAPKRLIIDTDLGTDVDDCLALALAVQSPEIRIEAITCVYADVELRGRMASKLLRLAGLEEVPVALGSRQPLLRRVPLFWQGHEGSGLLSDDDRDRRFDPRHAANLIVDLARERPGERWLLAIGPLTDVALALELEPRLPDLLAGVVTMGGTLRGPASGGPPAPEHNVRCDPESAYLVYRSGLRLQAAPIDVTTQVRITTDVQQRVAGAGSDFQRAVAAQLALYPPFKERGWTFPHDALALMTMLRPDLFEFGDYEVDVDLGSDAAQGFTLARPVPEDGSPRAVRIATRVDAARFERELADRLAAPLRTRGVVGDDEP